VLAATGRFTQMAPRRAAETARFVADVARSRGLERFTEGFRTTVQVRLMHAFVRRHVAGSSSWQSAAWGVPVSQHDMLGTILLFSVAFVYGVRRLGLVVSRDERDAVNHLWRYVGRLLGVHDDLLPATFDDAIALFRLCTPMQRGPDSDSRALTRALLAVPRVDKEAGSIPWPASSRRTCLRGSRATPSDAAQQICSASPTLPGRDRPRSCRRSSVPPSSAALRSPVAGASRSS
jgi:hypothetical protein